MEVFVPAYEALSIVDERKDGAGITSNNSQILPSSNYHIYTLMICCAMSAVLLHLIVTLPNYRHLPHDQLGSL
jgi:hypothetical protein